MKFKHILTAAALMLSIGAIAQPPMPKPEDKKEGEGFKFTTIMIRLPFLCVNLKYQ